MVLVVGTLIQGSLKVKVKPPPTALHGNILCIKHKSRFFAQFSLSKFFLLLFLVQLDRCLYGACKYVIRN